MAGRCIKAVGEPTTVAHTQTVSCDGLVKTPESNSLTNPEGSVSDLYHGHKLYSLTGV